MVATKPTTMLSKSTVRLKHHRYQQCSSERRAQYVVDALSRDANTLLFRWLQHHRQQQRSSSSHQHRPANASSLPSVITTGSGTVWKRSVTDELVYEKTDAPHQLLHVIPDNDDTSTTQSSPALQIAASASMPTRALRCPAPLPYIGRPLPVAPSLPPAPKHKGYLVRPRFPVNVQSY